MKINRSTIIHDDDPLIRQKSEDVILPLSAEDEMTIKAMYDYVNNSTIKEIAEAEDLQPAVGISAVQIGILKKMLAVIIKDEEGKIVNQYALINPKIISHSVEKGYLANGEGCLSVPEGHEGYVYRPIRIKIKAYDYLTKQDVIIKAKDYPAIVLQHELDHLKGILYYDHIDKDDPFKVDPEAGVIE